MHTDRRMLGQVSPTIQTEVPAMACSFLQTLFGYCPTVVLPQPAIMTSTPAAPRTRAELAPGGWTLEDLGVQSQLDMQRRQALTDQLVKAYGGMNTNPPPEPPAKCNWYQKEDSDGGCTFGSSLFWIAAGGGVAAVLYLKR